jgi:hypothetical protein
MSGMRKFTIGESKDDIEMIQIKMTDTLEELDD